jgi:hypothetical protein
MRSRSRTYSLFLYPAIHTSGLGSYDQDNDPTEIDGYAPVIERKED